MQLDLEYVVDVREAVTDSDAVLVLTEWRDYRYLDPFEIASLVRTQAILDGRNCLNPADWRAAGWTYRALGRQ